MERNYQQDKYFRAKERVNTIQKFYGKIVSAIVTIALVASLNYYLDQWQHPWFLWVVFGFGISLVLKAIKIFNFNPFTTADWEKRKIEEFMQQEEKSRRWN